jgi:glycosyltransferase involved in cell wall biosynthesis
VIASDINGIPEVITHGQDGLLFPPGDYAALAERMATLARDEPLRLQLARNARAKAEAEFTPEERVRALRGVIAHVCKQKLPLETAAGKEVSRA